MVTSTEYNEWKTSRSKKEKDVQNDIINNEFWNDCFVVIQATTPLVRLLRLMDFDEKPVLGYVYGGVNRAINAIIEYFKHQNNKYEPYTNIVQDKWQNTLLHDIHAAAYFLNPVYQYDEDAGSNSPEVMRMLQTILHNSHVSNIDGDKLAAETAIYRRREGSFATSSALTVIKTSKPGNIFEVLFFIINFYLFSYLFIFYLYSLEDCWGYYGHNAPNLQKIAIRLLSQTVSSSGCERNWSVFKRIHTKRRNRLEHQKLSDLVFIHYNLRLKNMYITSLIYI